VTVRASAALTDDEAAAVIEVSQTVTAEGGTIRVKVADKRSRNKQPNLACPSDRDMVA
jgi:hypothetical protein